MRPNFFDLRPYANAYLGDSSKTIFYFEASPKDRRAPSSTNTFIPMSLHKSVDWHFGYSLSRLGSLLRSDLLSYFPSKHFYCKRFSGFLQEILVQKDRFFKNKNLSFFFSILFVYGPARLELQIRILSNPDRSLVQSLHAHLIQPFLPVPQWNLLTGSNS